MWTYNSATGDLSHDGDGFGKGYSGNGSGLDNPAMETVHDVGPIPRGNWTIGAFFDDQPAPGHPSKGPLVAHLVPNPETEVFGRAGFMIHGDNAARNQTASEGCMILDHPFRESIRDSHDTDLQVVSSAPPAASDTPGDTEKGQSIS